MSFKNINRKAGRRELANQIIISCEGKETEPKYFNGIRKHLRLPTLNIFVVSPDGTDPITVVDRAIEEIEERKAAKRWIKGDTAWAIFDGDEHRQTTANEHKWNTALQRARANDIRLGISNPSIEFWFLIHFRDHTSHIDRHKAIDLLKIHIPNYEKNIEMYPGVLENLTDAAIGRAEQIATLARKNKLPEFSNPSCEGVSELVQLILKLKSQ